MGVAEGKARGGAGLERAGAGMWVIDCSPVPDKAECGRAGNWATQGRRQGCSRLPDFHSASHLPNVGNPKAFVPD